MAIAGLCPETPANSVDEGGLAKEHEKGEGKRDEPLEFVNESARRFKSVGVSEVGR